VDGDSFEWWPVKISWFVFVIVKREFETVGHGMSTCKRHRFFVFPFLFFSAPFGTIYICIIFFLLVVIYNFNKFCEIHCEDPHINFNFLIKYEKTQSLSSKKIKIKSRRSLTILS